MDGGACYICQRAEGYLTLADGNRWVHKQCALSVRGCLYNAVNSAWGESVPSPLVRTHIEFLLPRVLSKQAQSFCCVCHQRQGCLIKCSSPSCTRCFHPSCLSHSKCVYFPSAQGLILRCSEHLPEGYAFDAKKNAIVSENEIAPSTLVRRVVSELQGICEEWKKLVAKTLNPARERRAITSAMNEVFEMHRRKMYSCYVHGDKLLVVERSALKLPLNDRESMMAVKPLMIAATERFLEKSVSVVEKESEVVPEMSVELSSSSDGSSVEFVPSDGGVNEKKALGMKLRRHRSKRVAREKGQSDDSTAYVSESSEGEEKREEERAKREEEERKREEEERKKREEEKRKEEERLKREEEERLRKEEEERLRREEEERLRKEKEEEEKRKREEEERKKREEEEKIKEEERLKREEERKRKEEEERLKKEKEEERKRRKREADKRRREELKKQRERQSSPDAPPPKRPRINHTQSHPRDIPASVAAFMNHQNLEKKRKPCSDDDIARVFNTSDYNFLSSKSDWNELIHLTKQKNPRKCAIVEMAPIVDA